MSVVLVSIYIRANIAARKTSTMQEFHTLNQASSEDWQHLRLLTANVGNLSLSCKGAYNNKLCQLTVEKAIAEHIKTIRPDIIFFQELLHPSQCEDLNEADRNKVCYKKNEADITSYQPQRLLGKNYSILCAARMREEIGHPLGMECIGVHVDFGSIEGCDRGQICFTSQGLDSPASDCNPEFIVMSAIVKVGDLRIGLINGHPHSRNKSCQDNSIKQIFEGVNGIPLVDTDKIIIAGDFNFDPFRGNNVPKSWQLNVGMFGSGLPFYYHSGLVEHEPPYPTAYFLFQKKTVDHVISNFAWGVCTTLGEAPGTRRIDNGKGMDHRAVMCDLLIPASYPCQSQEGK